MIFTSKMMLAEREDSDLVVASLRGDRDAFAEIVRRYQSLICSLTYNATGSLAESEDLAQETFVVAWRQLKTLQEPGKIRSWLCGIARNIVNNAVRSKQRHPTNHAESIETLNNLPGEQPSAVDGVIRQEEEAILWRSIERIPESYREPLILFYREGESVERVAAQLDLTEDAVKQRLSRGRKMLAEEVNAFVEGALKRSAPGRAFTLGVLAALPVFATSATAATVSAGAAKGTATATGATFISILTALLGPLIGILGGYVGYRSSLNATRTPREGELVKRMAINVFGGAVAFNVVFFAFIYAATRYWKHYPVLFAVVGTIIPVTFAAWIFYNAIRHNREFRRVRQEEQRAHPELFEPTLRESLQGTEYRSKLTFLGLPLLHTCNGVRVKGKTKPAIGWIAFGDKAYGILFAAGGLAVGGIAMGGAAIGLVAFGGAALGALALGGLAVGGLALGGAAIGVMAFGGMATAWLGAMGGMAVSGSYALGGNAIAPHANDAEAREFFTRLNWTRLSHRETWNWIMLICWSPMLLFLVQALLKKRKK